MDGGGGGEVATLLINLNFGDHLDSGRLSVRFRVVGRAGGVPRTIFGGIWEWMDGRGWGGVAIGNWQHFNSSNRLLLKQRRE